MPRHQPVWHISEEHRTTISAAALNRLINGEGIRHTLLRRALASRTVAYLEPDIPGLPPLYLKEYHPKTFAGRMKHLLCSPADKEWNMALRIGSRGVSTFAPLALGRRRRFALTSASYLITRAIDHAAPLRDYLTEHRDGNSLPAGASRRRIMDSLARFVKDLHCKGVVHHDFHWGNILIDTVNKGAISWYLTDLHRASLKNRLGDRHRVSNLAALNTAFRYTTRKTDRLRFLICYAQGDRRWEKRLQYFARLIEKRSERMIRRIWRKQERRCLGDNKYFQSFRSSACRGFMRRDASSPELGELLQNPGVAFLSPGSILVKDSRTTSSCTLPVQTGEQAQALFIKRYNYQDSLYAFKNLFRSSRAKRVWRTAQALLSRNILTPVPLAYAERRRSRVLRESFYVTRRVEHSISLAMLFTGAETTEKAQPVPGKNNLIHQVAVLIRRMHERGIWHRDLKAANILVQGGSGENLQLYLTDLDSIRVKGRVMPEERIRDLARLNVSLFNSPALSLRDRYRFLCSYLNAGRTGDKNLRAHWEAIRRETGKKLAKDR